MLSPAERESDSRSGPADAWNAIPHSGGRNSGMGFPIGVVRMVECNSRSGGGDSGTRLPIPATGVAERDSGSR